MSTPTAPQPPSTGITATTIAQAHQLYCQLTGQNLRLGFERERMWFEILRTGYSLEDLRGLILYLQREIRAERRNIGALKLSNLLHPDRFEEDLNLSRVRLSAPPPAKTPMALRPPTCSPAQQERGRQRFPFHHEIRWKKFTERARNATIMRGWRLAREMSGPGSGFVAHRTTDLRQDDLRAVHFVQPLAALLEASGAGGEWLQVPGIGEDPALAQSQEGFKGSFER